MNRRIANGIKAVYKNLGNSFALFLQDEVVFHPEAKVHSKELKEKLAVYEEENGMEKTPPAKIKEMLQENGKVLYKKFSFKGKNSWGYAGMGLKSDFPELCKNLDETRDAEGEGKMMYAPHYANFDRENFLLCRTDDIVTVESYLSQWLEQKASSVQESTYRNYRAVLQPLKACFRQCD